MSDVAQLWEYAAIYQPKDGEASLVVPISTCLARTREIAMAIAARSVPTDYAGLMNDVTLVIRPFV